MKGHIVDPPGDRIRKVSNPREELLAFGDVLVLVFETANVRFKLVDPVHDLRCPLLEFLFVDKAVLKRIQQSVTFSMELRHSFPGVAQLGGEERFVHRATVAEEALSFQQQLGVQEVTPYLLPHQVVDGLGEIVIGSTRRRS